MTAVEIVVPASFPRNWQAVLIERLAAAGHAVAVTRAPEAYPWPAAMRLALALERRVFRRAGDSLAETVEIADRPGASPPALRLDLCGTAPPGPIRTLQMLFDGHPGDRAAVAALASGRLPEITVIEAEGRPVAHAAPMVDRRVFLALAVEDVLARAITLALAVAAGSPQDAPVAEAAQPAEPGFVGAYLGHALPALAREALRRTNYRSEHWRVGYRFLDGPGVADTGRLGEGWSVLADDGTHFYADPFPFIDEGRHYLFVEDYPHATRKAAISMTILEEGRPPGQPEVVLEEAHHLSYPHVFAHEGEIFMLPEASASDRLTLYRAARFPDRWEPEAVLVEGAQISDATLLSHAGRLYLFATDRDGRRGSTSDTLVVFCAERLTGPWRPHPANPIAIDLRRARPGGAVMRRAGGLFLPIQDGTLCYGGGLGLSRIEVLDTEQVRLSEPVPISGSGDFPYPMIHTLNRAGTLEVIDGIAAVRKRQPSSSSRS